MNIRERFRRFGFRTKISLSIVSILLLLGISLIVVISRQVSQALVSENKVRGVSSAVNLAARANEPMLTMDFLVMKNLVDEVVQTNRDTAYTFLLDERGNPVVHTFTGGFPTDLLGVNTVREGENHSIRLISTGAEEIYDIAAPVYIGKTRIGTARIGMSLTRVQAVVAGLVWTIVGSIVIGVLIVGIVSTFLAQTVTSRIQQLHHAAEEIIKGNLDIHTALPLKNPCYDLMHCDKTGCPAYGNDDHRCWYLVGTLCPSCAGGKYDAKIDKCRICDVYKSNAGDEVQHLAEFFDVMALTLKERLAELKRTEESLSNQKQLFQTILDVTPDMVSLKDRSFRYQAVNKAFCRFVGKDEGEILGKSDDDIFPAGQAEESRGEDLEVISTRGTIRMRKEVAWHDGGSGTRWFDVIKTAVLDPQGEVMGILGSNRDITEIKELEDRVIHSQRLESIGQLAAGVAHEINTPLGIILGYAQLLLEDVQPGTESYDNLRNIEKYARVSKTIVADLLRFSRQSESIKKPVDINGIVSQVIGVVDHTFRLDHVIIERHLGEGIPLVHGDEEKLGQVFMNLLNNARDAIGSDGRITVTTGTDPATGEVVISVADTGKGIPAGIRDRIFDPFFTTKGVGRGTGLGLSVTFGIVKDHGGSIDFRSPVMDQGEQAGGTVFVVRLPALKEN